jgi:hypothetical protein
MDFRKEIFMNTRSIVIGSLVLLILLGGGYLGYKNFIAKPDHLSQFNVTPERMAKDLEGRQAALAFGQAWPFEAGQGIVVTVLAKKQVDEFVIVAVELKASAKVEPPQTDKKDEKPKEPPVKLNVALSGVAKLTYERIGNEWYMIGVEGLSLRATPYKDQ